MLIDTHCHLFMDPLYGNVEGVLQRALESGVGAVVVPSVEVDSWEKTIELSKHPAVYPALGLHPWNAFEKLAKSSGSVAIGEITLLIKLKSKLGAN